MVGRLAEKVWGQLGCTDEASCQVVAEAVGSTFFGASATMASPVIIRPTIEAARLKSHQ